MAQLNRLRCLGEILQFFYQEPAGRLRVALQVEREAHDAFVSNGPLERVLQDGGIKQDTFFAVLQLGIDNMWAVNRPGLWINWGPMKRVTEQVTKMVEAVRQARTTGQVLVKIGIDAHLSTLVIAEQTEEQAPKPPRKLSIEALLKMIAAHRHAGKAVVTCYEAGPLGFGLHEQLEAAGAHNLVVRPRALQQYGCPLKTDRRDAQQLTGNLDRFVAGNTQALAPVAIPDEPERIRRTHGRQREHLSRQRRRELQQARGVALFHGYPLRGD